MAFDAERTLDGIVPLDPEPTDELLDQAPLSTGAIALLVAASFGAAIAFLVPMIFSLALRVDQIEPGNTAGLGYIIGVGAAFALVSAPLTGIVSDRTRSRWGRRRPFTVGGALLGLAGVPFMAFAPNLLLLGIGWVITSVGWGTAMASIGNYQADRLPPSQRGKVSGLTGMVTQVAPVVGVLLAGAVARDPLMLILLPMLVGTPLVVAFVIFAREGDSRHLRFESRLTAVSVLKSFGFRPASFPDFSWNWLGRFVFFLGISLTTTYGTVFYASRLGIPVQEIAPIVAIISAVSIVAASVGAVVGGSLSDRFGRRRPFILGGAVFFAGGAVVSAFAPTLEFIILGGILSASSIAMFLAVNQAMVLDVLPFRETQAGRFMAITGFAQKIPNAVAPLIAPAILALGSASGANFQALYLVTASLVLAGGAIIFFAVRGVR
jgi:MFS family permease